MLGLDKDNEVEGASSILRITCWEMAMATNAAFVVLPKILENATAKKLYDQYQDDTLTPEL